MVATSSKTVVPLKGRGLKYVSVFAGNVLLCNGSALAAYSSDIWLLINATEPMLRLKFSDRAHFLTDFTFCNVLVHCVVSAF